MPTHDIMRAVTFPTPALEPISRLAVLRETLSTQELDSIATKDGCYGPHTPFKHEGELVTVRHALSMLDYPTRRPTRPADLCTFPCAVSKCTRNIKPQELRPIQTAESKRMTAMTDTSAQTFAIRSPSNALVLNPADWSSIATFTTRKAARAYADLILPQMPSKDTPLRVVVYAPKS